MTSKYNAIEGSVQGGSGPGTSGYNSFSLNVQLEDGFL